MKINWGTGITIVLIVFVLFILGLVYGTSVADFDLVAEDYYRQELVFQEKIDATRNARELNGSLELHVSEGLITITCDAGSTPAEQKGIIRFVRPNNTELDRSFELDLSSGEQVIATSDLLPGVYTAFLSWDTGNKEYLIKRELIVALH